MTAIAFKFLLTFLGTSIISGVIGENLMKDDALKKYADYIFIGALVGIIISVLILIWSV